MLRTVFRIRKDPYYLPGSGSVSYSNEHNNITWKEKFNKVQYAFLLGPVEPTDKENQVKVYKKYRTVLGTLPLWLGKDPDPYQIKSIIRIRIWRAWNHNTGQEGKFFVFFPVLRIQPLKVVSSEN